MSRSATLCIGCQHALPDVALYCPSCGRPKLRDMEPDALLGQLLGERFQIQTRIGYGGSGVVYRAEHVTLRRKVAVKVLHEELSRDELALERFRREATTVTEIDNDHLVEIFDFGRTPDGRLYLAMELLEGESLDTVLARERRLSVEHTADILVQVGQALMEAHAIGYVHRDLRPRNIYLAVRHGRPNFIKVLDFGLAKLVESDASASSTNLGKRFGDPRYMSPEQASGDRIDRRSDIYQLGCVAYEMLTGAPPFVGDRVFEILTKQVVEIPKPLPSRRPGVPLWMEAACTKMLAKDPIHRFVTATRMIEALQRGLETGEVMTDDDARQREPVLPPSVSRVMQRMGVPEAYVARSEVVHQRPVLPAYPVPEATSPGLERPDHAVESPPVGKSAGPEMESSACTAGEAVPELPQSGESARWYEEGDQASHEAEAANRDRARKLITPSIAEGSNWNAAPNRRPLLLVAGALVVTVGLGWAMRHLRSDSSESSHNSPSSAVASAVAHDARSQQPVVVRADAAPAPDAPVARSEQLEPSASSADQAEDRPHPATVEQRPSPPASKAKARMTRSAPLPSRPSPQVSRARPAPMPPPSSQTLPPGAAPIGSLPNDPYPSEAPPGPLPPTEPGEPSSVSGTPGPLDPYGGDSSTAQEPANREQGEADGVIRSAEAALEQRRFADAIALLQRAVQQVPTSARALTLLGEAYAGSGQYAAAGAAFKRALQIDPDNSRARRGYEQAASRVPPPSGQ